METFGEFVAVNVTGGMLIARGSVEFRLKIAGLIELMLFRGWTRSFSGVFCAAWLSRLYRCILYR